jgi:hypothetical protein
MSTRPTLPEIERALESPSVAGVFWAENGEVELLAERIEPPDPRAACVNLIFYGDPTRPDCSD